MTREPSKTLIHAPLRVCLPVIARVLLSHGCRFPPIQRLQKLERRQNGREVVACITRYLHRPSPNAFSFSSIFAFIIVDLNDLLRSCLVCKKFTVSTHSLGHPCGIPCSSWRSRPRSVGLKDSKPMTHGLLSNDRVAPIVDKMK